MEFSKNYLQKYGWEEGEGLGKNNTGIKKAVSLKLKLDKLGFGCSPSIDFTDHWWGKKYNEALANITTSSKFENDSSSLKAAQNSSEKSKKVKIIKSRNNHKQETTNAPWDLDELYKACAGRTAHKGARHGLQLSGKLQRLQQQDQALQTTKISSNAKLSEGDKTRVFHENSMSTERSSKKKRKRCNS